MNACNLERRALGHPLLQPGAGRSRGTRPSPAGAAIARAALGMCLAAGLGACGSSSGTAVEVPASGLPTPLPPDPLTGLSPGYYLPQPHSGGQRADLRIVNMEWGRLIDVFDTTGDAKNPSTLVFRDLLIDHTITESNLGFTLSANPVSGKEFVVVEHHRDSLEFANVIQELTDTQPVQAKGLLATELPPFTAVSRNSALVLNFNDLMDPATITPQNLLLLVGDPPTNPQEARIVPSKTHGAVLDGSFYPTRVIVDFTISTLEAKENPALKVNTLGLGSAQLVNTPNAVLRIPTLLGAGQYTLLGNLSAHGLEFASAGPSDPDSPHLDVLRSFRSQGKSNVTGDPNNGFLPDGIPPSVLGAQPIFAAQPVPGDPSLFNVTFTTPSCVMPLRPGDILEFNEFTFQVVQPGQLAGDSVINLRVLALSGSLAGFGPSFGLFRTAWDPALGAPPECFVRFDPQPGSAPAGDLPTGTTIIAEFSEPIDPSTVQALESFLVSYDVPPVQDNPLFENVVGRILPAADLRSFVFAPALPLRHLDGVADVYHVNIAADDPNTSFVEGVTDLAGNPLTFGLPQSTFSVSAGEAPQDTAGLSLRFVDPLGDEDGNGKPDLRGQHVSDPSGVLKPRGFQRFSTLLDAGSQPIIGAMPQTLGGIQTPLSDKGSKTQLLWRYIDMGFGLLDDNFHNLDVEGTNWSPFDPQVAGDKFTNFSIAMAHSFYFPDETVDGGLLPDYPASGLKLFFEDNLLDSVEDPLTIMAPKEKGYLIKSSDKFDHPQTGTDLVPWPINRDVPLSEYRYWTWRDTAKIGIGCGFGIGVDPARLQQILGGTWLEGFYPQNKVPTIGAPLLSEFRTYPDTGAFALNGFKTSFAINSSAKPALRAFSTGGIDAQGATQIIDPDDEPMARGGYVPISGQKTPALDNTFYWGQADFVVRVSRTHTVWYDTGAPSQFAPHVAEPDADEQPSGTAVTLAFRGASSIGAPSTPPEWQDATRIDPYGDGYTQAQLDMLSGTAGSTAPFTVTFFPVASSKAWKSSITELNGARYLQMRVTFTANPESGLTPVLSAVGIAFTHQ